MGGIPRRDQQQHLIELVLQAEILIADAERRIERHQKLWRAIAPQACEERRAHNELERNLLQGLALLYVQRAIALHAMDGSKVPRRLVALSQCHLDAASETRAAADGIRHAHLVQIIAWLDRVSHNPLLAGVIADQRERAVRELWDIQRRQLRRTGRPIPDSMAISSLVQAHPDL